MIDPHFQQVFSMALGIREPLFIKSLEMVPSSKDPEKLETRIEIDFRDGTMFQYGDPGDGYPLHDTRDRTFVHLNFFQYRCYITARVPRVKLHDGKVKTVDIPWVRDGSEFILMM